VIVAGSKKRFWLLFGTLMPQNTYMPSAGKFGRLKA